MAKAPQADKGAICPLHKQDVSKVCHKCPWYIMLRGKDPLSKHEIDNWGCAVGFLPILLIENAQMSRQTGAAVESFRNVVAQGGAELVAMITHSGAAALPPGEKAKLIAG